MRSRDLKSGYLMAETDCPDCQGSAEWSKAENECRSQISRRRRCRKSNEHEKTESAADPSPDCGSFSILRLLESEYPRKDRVRAEQSGRIPSQKAPEERLRESQYGSKEIGKFRVLCQKIKELGG